MATTDTRTGFRLPWSSDHRDPDEDPGAVDTADETSGPEGAEASAAEPMVSAMPGEPDAGASAPAEESQAVAHAAPTPVSTASHAAPFGADVYAPPSPAAKKPSKFLADLTAAMRTAAETERVDIVERFQTDAKAYIESIHERSAGDAVELRKQADEDIVEIRDWSKAEIARIREETDRKITGRKQDLDEELESHAARVEREIERIRSTVDGFEAQMAAFFEGLLAVDDPTRFAAIAANLPEPPSLDQVAAGTAKVTAPATPETSIVPPIQEDARDATSDASPHGETGWDPPQPTPTLTEEDTTTGRSDLDPWRDTTFGGATEGTEQVAAADGDAAAPDGPMAESTEATQAPHMEVDATPVAAETIEIESEAQASAGETEATLPEGTADEVSADQTEPQTETSVRSELDPRVAALGLTPDLAAAEAEAMSGSDAGDDGSSDAVPVLDDDTIAARLASFSLPTEPSPEAVKTQVIVTGLASVASISGFKRTLAQVAGVRQVSVASGPDGEFVFSVTHGPTVELTAVIPSMNGFAARVMGADDGVLRVAAHDPEAGS